MKKKEIIILSIIAIFLAGFAVFKLDYFNLKKTNCNYNGNKIVPVATPVVTPTVSPTPNPEDNKAGITQNKNGSYLYNGQFFSVSYPESWFYDSTYMQNDNEFLKISTISEETKNIINKSDINLSVTIRNTQMTDDSYANSLIKQLKNAQKEYIENNTGILDNIRKIDYKGLIAVRYTIHTNLPGIEISETDSIYFVNGNKYCLLRLTSYGENLDELEKIVKRDKPIFEDIINNFQLKK